MFKKSAHVVGLEHIAAKEDPGCSGGRNISDHVERVFVRRMSASTEHQDWYRTFFHYRAHGCYIPAVIRFNAIRAQFGCHTSVQIQPLGITRILHIFAARERFNNQWNSDSLTFAGDFSVASDLLHLELGITGADDEIGQNSICAMS